MLAGTYNPFAETALDDITITDDGDASFVGPASTVTFAARASTGPHSLVAFMAVSSTAITLNSATWGGNPVSILHTEARTGYLIGWLYIAGAQTGDLVLNFSVGVNCYITVASLENLISATPGDTDEDDLTGVASITLDNLASPGEGGIRLAVEWHSNTSTTAWTNATEIADISTGSVRYSVAYDLGDDAGTITASFSSALTMICGVSLR